MTEEEGDKYTYGFLNSIVLPVTVSHTSTIDAGGRAVL